MPTVPPSARAKLFTSGGSQAVRLPKQFRLPGTEVHVRKVGDLVILQPITKKWPKAFLDLITGPPERLFERGPQGEHERVDLFP